MTPPTHAAPRIGPEIGLLYVFGCGGFGREVAWLASQIFSEKMALSFLVDRPEYLQPPVNGLPVAMLSDLRPNRESVFVVAIGDPHARRKAAQRCLAAGLDATTLIHPRAEISQWVDIGAGTIICAGCIVTTNVSVGAHVHLNLGCTVGHDVIIGEFTTLSPGVHVSGHVHIGRGVFIGTGANIINGTSETPLVIGDGAVVAAGACVTRSIPSATLVAGVPAMPKKQLQAFGDFISPAPAQHSTSSGQHDTDNTITP